MVEPGVNRVVPRRRVLWLAGAGVGSLTLAACGGAEGQPGSSESSASQGGGDSSSATPSVSGEASAASSSDGETIVKGYSGGSKAPEGEYRPADEHGPAQNVPKPMKPAGMNVETVEGVVKFLNYWVEAHNYSIQTGDAQLWANTTSKVYENDTKSIQWLYDLYHNNDGWIAGGLRSIVIKEETFHKNETENEYKILTHVETQNTVVYDPYNHKISNTDHSDNNRKMIEVSVIFHPQERNWLVIDKRFVDVEFS
ncbi:MAG: DUF6318 family protein [Rothia sp. (in: high G+C Gram-positive bacteria)]|uniref:DUF6318 family protein n=1 Tax=Rothia sp. (in: high G+C Gram-positive bacteria) TaxID=1885016 RepID=UPI0026DBA5B7|nr:DUF6318 family protein [Rothia sp. (in: high G+C Gram-positive bacteria)]MDO4885033.1 DUF6318 family protein [Rothia sp. (in: high G+C Gram-positive bacteria)]